MVEGSRAEGQAPALMLKGSCWAWGVLSCKMEGFYFLLEVILGEISESDCGHLVPALLVDMHDRPIRVDGEHIGGLEVEVGSGSQASGVEGNVVIDGSREGGVSEVKDLEVSNHDTGIDIVDSHGGIISKGNGELAKPGREPPVPLIGHHLKGVSKLHVQL